MVRYRGRPRLGPIVPGAGPTPCALAFLAQCPGKDEVRAIPPRPLIGKAGQELTRFLDGALLPARSDVYLTNVTKQRPEHGEAPSAAEIAAWSPTLQDELERVHPDVIVALGAVAARWLCGPDVLVERVHGLPVPCLRSWSWGTPVVFVAYHPAAMLHSPDLQSHFAADMEALADGLTHGFPSAAPDTVPTQYGPLPLDAQIPPAFSIDTEGWPDAPWCATISWAPGVAYIVKAEDEARLAVLRAAMARATRVTCHSLLADLDVLAAMDLTIPDAAMDDTMVRAYNLALEPQGMKDLAYRHLRAEQDEYSDIVAEAEERATLRHVIRVCISTPNTRVQKAAARVLTKIANPEDQRPAKKIWGGSKFSKAVPPVPRTTLDEVDPEVAVRYACRDADLTERLVPILDARVRRAGLQPVYDLDMGVIPIVNRMQHVGMRVDLDHFASLLPIIEEEYSALLEQIAALVGRDLNPNSGKQVSTLLFTELGLPPTRMTKSRSWHTTEDKYLEALRSAHPVVPLIIDARECTKMRGAYCGAILDQARDGVIYPHLRITRVVSGRVSAFDPNVLAIPKHSVWGLLIRHGFLAGTHFRLISNDLSQIELRIMAHVSRDPFMLKVYREGGDLHARMAEAIFDIKPEDQDDSDHRLPTKKVNFGDIMGITALGLQAQLAAVGVVWPEDRCQELLDESRRVKKGVARWIADTHAQARRYGYVTDFLGRRRYCSGVHSSIERVRLAALREAQATPIQSGAQEVFKAWMGRVWRDVIRPRQRRWEACEPWLQVHDDLILHADRKQAEAVGQDARACLPQMLRVPVVAKGKTGRRWSEV